jgi:hypothetical protein
MTGVGVTQPVDAARRAARVAGVLLSLVSYLGIGLGTALLAPVRDASRDLLTIAPDRGLVQAGVLLELVNVAAIVGFAVVLFPYLKRAGEGMALGYVAMRVLEGAAYLVAGISTVSLVALSEDVAEGADAATYGALQAAALAQSESAGVMATPPFVVGAVLLYALLYRSRLVPRWLSVWGLIAVGLVVASNVFAPDTLELSPAAVLVVPMIVNEFWLAGWLIVKGFDRAALGADKPAPTPTPAGTPTPAPTPAGG